jgi:hypothetical protein
MVCTMAVKDEGGQTLWQKERAVPMRGFGAVGDNASQQLRDEMAKSFESILASTGSATESLPRYIFAPLEKILAGESQLGFHNETPPPAVKTGPGL